MRDEVFQSHFNNLHTNEVLMNLVALLVAQDMFDLFPILLDLLIVNTH